MREVVSLTHKKLICLYSFAFLTCTWIKVFLQKWEKSLAEMALGWAKVCSWEHGQPENVSPYEELGQNLYVSTGKTLDINDAITSWHNEITDYNFKDNTCAEGKMCGHYTQVVWDDTDVIGCAHFVCDKVTEIDPPLKDAIYIVCNYGPP